MSDLIDCTVDRELDQFLVAFAAGERAIDLRDDLAFGIEAIGVDCRNRADAAGCRPGTR